MNSLRVLAIASFLSAAAWAAHAQQGGGGPMTQGGERPMMCGGGQPMAQGGGQQQMMGCPCPMMSMMMGNRGMMQPPGGMQQHKPGQMMPDSGAATPGTTPSR